MQQHYFGNYRVVRLLEQGSAVDRYLGEHMYLGTQATIEMLPQEIAGIQLEPFLAEMRQVVLLKHPHIARVLEFGVQERTPFLVLNCVPSGTLRHHYPHGTRLSLQQACEYTYQVAFALQYAHDHGLLHRDIRPEHMLLGKNHTLWLSAFSLTVLRRASGVSVLPNYLYSAPEQIQGQPMPASDQYALAMVLYEWLTGQLPSQERENEALARRSAGLPKGLTGHNSGLPQAVEIVLTRALNPRPAERFATMSDFALALELASDIRITSELQGKTISSNIALLPEQEKNAPDLAISAVHADTMVVQVAGSATYTPPSPVFRSRREKTHVWRALSLILLLLVIGAGVGGGWLYLRAPGRQPPATPATAAATLSPQALYQRVTTRQPVLDDALSSSSQSTWPENRSFTSANYCLFKNGYYQVSAEQAFTTICLSTAGVYNNFAFQVEIMKITGSNAGLVFRSSPDDKQSYAFSLTADGAAFIIQLTHNSIPISLSFGQLASKLSFPLLLAVIAQDTKLTFYINGQPVKQLFDSTLNSGQIGLVAWDRNKNTGAVADFRHAQIWKVLST